MAEKVKQILQNEKLLKSNNENWMSYYEDLADFCLPRKSWISAPKYAGERLNFNFLYDSTAIRAVKIMSAGFHSNMTNPTTKWFDMVCTGKDAQMLNENRDVKQYWYDTVDVLIDMLRGSNFDTSMQEFYNDFAVFGVGDICSLKDYQTKIRFKTIPVEQTQIEEDANGRVCAVYQTFKLTAIQAFMLWGDKVGKSVMDKILEDKYYVEFEFMWYVGPRERRDFSKKDNLNKAWESLWIQKKDEHLMEESGFDEFPHHYGRFWKEANDPRGTSPAMDVLCDIRLKNAMKRTTLRRAMKEADPPLTVPDRGFILPLNFNPGAINYRDRRVANDAIQPMAVGAGNFQITEMEIQEIKSSIEEGFFVPLFRALSQIDKQMTVPEVQRRILENMVLLGPVVGRCQHEVLDPMITRLYYEAGRQGLLPKLPDALRGREFGPIYMSPLAKAQKASAIGDIQAFLQMVGSMANFAPGVLDKVDADASIDVIAGLMSVNPKILTESDKIKEIRGKREQLSQMQMQMQAGQGMAEIASTAGKAKEANAKATAQK